MSAFDYLVFCELNSYYDSYDFTIFRHEYLEVEPQKDITDKMLELGSKNRSDVPPLEFC